MNHDIGRNAVMPPTQSYNEWKRELETYIEHSKLEAVFNVNKALLSLYWHIGSDILEKSKTLGWGAQVVSDGTDKFGQVSLDQISWYHHISLLSKVKDDGRVIEESVMDVITDKLPISDTVAEKLTDIYLMSRASHTLHRKGLLKVRVLVVKVLRNIFDDSTI